jgi:alkylhydroperoxidase family enzyme
MSNIASLQKALVARVLEGDGQASASLRRLAFNNEGLEGPVRELVDKVVHKAYSVTDQEVAAVRAAGLSEDAIFEIVVCAAIGQATRQYESALAVLDGVASQI